MSELDAAALAEYDRQLAAFYAGELDLADLPPMPGSPNKLPMNAGVAGGMVRISREAMEVFAGGPSERSTSSIYLEHGDPIEARCQALIAAFPRADGRYEMDASWARGSSSA